MFVVSARGWSNPHSFFSPARCAGKLTRRISRRSSNDELRRHLRSPGVRFLACTGPFSVGNEDASAIRREGITRREKKTAKEGRDPGPRVLKSIDRGPIPTARSSVASVKRLIQGFWTFLSCYRILSPIFPTTLHSSPSSKSMKTSNRWIFQKKNFTQFSRGWAGSINELLLSNF